MKRACWIFLPPHAVWFALILLAICPQSRSRGAEAKRTPNFIVIFADDLGYGDLGCFGHPTIRTPNLDRMAAEGIRLTQFYSAGEVCTPSRAALLTGRYPVRSGMASSRRRVLFPNSGGGLPDEEITIAELLKKQGYATGCIGKWHLGHLPQYLPTRNGFDSYFGIPYSNDMKPTPLLRNEEVLEEPAQQDSLTKRYTQEAVKFITAHREGPFFLYFAHTFPHVPLFASEKFKQTSPRGLYGDVVEELDDSVGQVLAALKEQGLDENTLVIFTSDNGPWLTQKLRGGSAGLLRGGKGSTWEGGMREPTIAHWPGHIKPGSVSPALASTLDVFATLAALSGAELPEGLVLDSHDLTGVLTGDKESPRQDFFYYRGTDLMAARLGPFKAHLQTQDGYGQPTADKHDPPLLFQLDNDPAEQYDVAKQNPEVLERIRASITAHLQSVKDVPSQLEIPLPKPGEPKSPDAAAPDRP